MEVKTLSTRKASMDLRTMKRGAIIFLIHSDKDHTCPGQLEVVVIDVVAISQRPFKILRKIIH